MLVYQTTVCTGFEMSSLRCDVDCWELWGGGKGEGESEGREGQSGNNQGQVWTRICTTRVKGDFQVSKGVIYYTNRQRGETRE